MFANNLLSRLADWSDDEPSTIKQTSSRFDKLVVVKHVFTQEQLKTDEDLYSDIMEDMKEEGARHGSVKNVTIFDQEEDGVVTVRFSNAMDAQSFRDAVHGRGYQKRKLVASIATGGENFKKSRKGEKDKDEEEAKRLEEYSKFIEGKDGDSKGD